MFLYARLKFNASCSECTVGNVGTCTLLHYILQHFYSSNVVMKWKTMKLSEQEITVNIALHVCKIYVKEWEKAGICVTLL